MRKWTKERGETQAQFAKAVDAGAGTVTAWLKGEYYPNGEILIKIIRELGIDAHWLLTGEGSRTPHEASSAALKLQAIRAILDEDAIPVLPDDVDYHGA